VSLRTFPPALLASAALVALVACGRRQEALEPEADADAGELVALPTTDAGMGDAGTPREKPVLYALDIPTPVFSAPEWPPKDPTKATEARIGVVRLGVLRRGQAVPIKPRVLKKSNCAEGWYELETGGFVCGKSVTLEANDPALARAPQPPRTDLPLPYDYGLNLTNGTPLYNRAPTKRERKLYEAGLPVGKGAKPVAAEGSGGKVPWYLQDHKGEKPKVSFDDMRGEAGFIEQRMARGFYLALDKQVSAFSGKFWQTTRGMLVPADHVLVHRSVTEFEGVFVGRDDEPRKLPLAFVIGPHTRKYFLDPDRVRRGEKVDRFSVVALSGKSELREKRRYYETNDGYYLRDFDIAVTKPGPVPTDLAKGERWIDVNITTQSLVAFEGDKPYYATILSSGRTDATDPAHNYKTPVGTFYVREKYITTTMDDDSAADGPYKIEDVPWVMYFKGGYALHGAFWHSRFGRERSHGCVNLTPHDARIVFDWAGPKLPEGWHGVVASPDNPGTRVVVHE
jgi:hypothetical protein